MGDYNLDINILKDICPIYNDHVDQESDLNANTTYNISENEGTIMLLKDRYITKVEYGNSYIDKLLKTEEDYFKRKYGEEVYNYLLSKRNDFIDKENSATCSSIISGSGSSSTSSTSTLNPNLFTNSVVISSIMSDISNEYDTYKLFQNNTSTDASLITILKQNKNVMNKELNDLYAKNSTNQRKIEYRTEELKRIATINYYLTVSYYIFVMIFIVVALIHGRIYNLLDWALYILLLLFPYYIFPFIFFYLKRLMNFLSFKMEFHGPKNAFLNEKLNINFIDNHNI